MAVVSTTTPLPAGTSFTSATQFVQRGTYITGTVFSDVAGTLKIRQGGDGTNWDSVTSYNISAGIGLSFSVDLINQYWSIVYTNGSVDQVTFRLSANPRDPYGSFLAAAQAPSPGGAYAVLVATPTGGYSYVGRFDAADGFSACGNAAIFANTSGKYASFLVNTATVSDEVVTKTTTHTPDSF